VVRAFLWMFIRAVLQLTYRSISLVRAGRMNNLLKAHI
jgi:hypothetical protein